MKTTLTGISQVFRALLLASGFVCFVLVWTVVFNSGTASAATCGAGTAFMMVVDTTQPGTTTNTQFRIPTTGSSYNYQVDINGDDDWADTSVGAGWNETTNRTGAVTIDFGAPGTYTVSVCGTFGRIFFNNTGDREKLMDITQWGDNAWTAMSSAFHGCVNLTGTFTDTPNVSAVTSLVNMFRGASNFNGDISGWDTSNVTTMTAAFYDASLFNQSLNSWDTGLVNTLSNMFRGAVSFNQPLGDWNTSNVTSLNSMFSGATAFNQNINTWDTSNVINMGSVFNNALAFNQPLGSWDTSSVTNFAGTFNNATSFDQDITTWDMGAATSIAGMFNGATSFNQPIGNWNIANVTNFGSVFRAASSFNQPLNNWDTSNATTMSAMFAGASMFNQPLSSWDTGSVTTMANMFGGFYTEPNLPDITIYLVPMAFNQDISGWDTSSVTNMYAMFGTDVDSLLARYTAEGYTNIIVNGPEDYVYPFNQNLGSWDMSGILADPAAAGYFTGASAMLSNTLMSGANYDATLMGWSTQTLQSGVVLGAHTLEYCTSQAARQAILDQGWNIEGDSYDCSVSNEDGALTDTGNKVPLSTVGSAVLLLTASLTTVRRRQKRYVWRG